MSSHPINMQRTSSKAKHHQIGIGIQMRLDAELGKQVLTLQFWI